MDQVGQMGQVWVVRGRGCSAARHRHLREGVAVVDSPNLVRVLGKVLFYQREWEVEHSLAVGGEHLRLGLVVLVVEDSLVPEYLD